MSSVIRLINCVLNGPADWDEWFDSIQTAAKVANIWKYVNPETKKDTQLVLVEPVYPTPNDVRDGAQQLQNLEPIE